MLVQDNKIKICRHLVSSLFFDSKNRAKLCPYYDEAII